MVKYVDFLGAVSMVLGKILGTLAPEWMFCFSSNLAPGLNLDHIEPNFGKRQDIS